MSDMAGELSDKQKQRLEENEDRIREQDRELEEQKEQLLQLSLLVDEQQKQIDVREGKLSDHEVKIVKHQRDSVKKNLQLVQYTDELEKTVEDQLVHMDQIEKELYYYYYIIIIVIIIVIITITITIIFIIIIIIFIIIIIIVVIITITIIFIIIIIIFIIIIIIVVITIIIFIHDHNHYRHHHHQYHRHQYPSLTPLLPSVLNKSSSDLYKVGMRCRGERHEQVIARQKEALMDFRKKTKMMEQLKAPLPSHEQSLQQIVVLKNELSEIRASIANKEEDYHKTESEMHSEVNLIRWVKMYLKLARTLAALLEVSPLPGSRSMAYIPIEERERLEQERDQDVELMVNRVNRLHERLDRKEKLLGGYEDDLIHLRLTYATVKKR
ncbi:hypothetical protein QZH41_004986 [Actinostola sp. cb2023]|nr:hypothetical protein QZH41_004986 [Actinostola sp. cb2023]